MADQDAYVALIASLPRLDGLFVKPQPPLSRLRLDRRLSSLEPEDKQVLVKIEALLDWSAYDMQTTNKQVLRIARALRPQLGSATLLEIVEERLDVRSLVAALRMRAAGKPPPTGRWAPSRRASQITANWTDPVFGMVHAFPWLSEAEDLIRSHQALALERLLLRTTLDMLERHAARHFFDFEAVVIYVLKWNIFDRWHHANGVVASRRFAALTDVAMGGFCHNLKGEEPHVHF